MLTPQQATARAQAGAQYLDSISVDWPSRINLRKLNISSPCDCMLGQLTGDYDAAVRNLPPDSKEAFGFDVPQVFGEMIQGYHTQTLAWMALVAARQAA